MSSACRTAASACPVGIGMPNLLSSVPVVVLACVCGSMPGERRRRIFWRTPRPARCRSAAAARGSCRRRCGRCRSRAPRAALAPTCCCRGSGCAPPESRPSAATASSPPETTSSDMPSCAMIPAMRAPEVRLRRVGDDRVVVARLERLLERAALAAQRLFVEDVQRRPKLARQLDRVAAAEREVAGVGDAGGEGKDVREGDFGCSDQGASFEAIIPFGGGVIAATCVEGRGIRRSRFARARPFLAASPRVNNPASCRSSTPTSNRSSPALSRRAAPLL